MVGPSSFMVPFPKIGVGEEDFSDYLRAAFLQPSNEVGRCLASCCHVVEYDGAGTLDFGVVDEPPVFVILDLVVLGEMFLFHFTPVVDPFASVGDMAVLAYQVGKKTVSLGGILPR